MNEVFNGTVIWFNNGKGFGFIKWSKDGLEQNDLFVYWSDIDMQGYKTLQKDQVVSFEIGTNHSGKPKAILVKTV